MKKGKNETPSSDQSTSYYIISAKRIADKKKTVIHKTPAFTLYLNIAPSSYMHNYSIYRLAPLHSRSTCN